MSTPTTGNDVGKIGLDLRQQGANLLARVERLPFSSWHVKLRLIVGVATFFDAFDALSIAYAMPVLIRLWHLRPGDIGLLISSGYVGQLIGALFFGWIAERYGRKKSLLASIFVLSVMSIGCACAWSYASLFTVRFIQGIGLGGEVPVAAAYISEWSKAKGRGKFFMFYESIFIIGLMGAALAGFFMVPTLGWRSMFILGAFPGVFILFFLRSVPESPRWMVTHGRLADAERTIDKVESIVARSYGKALPPLEVKLDYVTQKKSKVGELFQGIYRRRTLLVWTMWFCGYFMSNGLQTWLPTLYTSIFKIPLRQALFYNMFTYAAGLVVYFGGSMIIDRAGRKPLFVIAYLGLACSCVSAWMIGLTSAHVLLFFSVLNFAFINFFNGAIYLYTPELYPTRMRALGITIATAWLRAASVVSPIVTGFVVSHYSLGRMFLLWAAIALFVAIVVGAFAVETKNRPLEEVSP